MTYTKENIKEQKELKIKVITLSDRASRGEYSDKSGKLIIEMISEHFKNLGWKYKVDYLIIPDDFTLFKVNMIVARDQDLDIIFTTGGTGISPRDITPDVVSTFIDKEIPGIMDFIRIKYGQTNPNALLSRSIAGFMKQTQIYSLPGSSRAVQEYMTEILKIVEHLIYMYYNIDIH